VRQPHVAFPPAEQRLEHGAEVLPHFAERLEEHRFRRLVDLARRLLQRLARGHEIVALRHQELEALHFLGVLVDRERVHRSDRVDRRPEPVVLLAQPLHVSRHCGGLGEQLIERLAPLGLDLRDEPAAGPENLGPLELELVLLGAPGLERGAGGVERALGPGEARVRLRHLRFRVARRSLQRAHRDATLLEGALPLRLLRRERRGILVQRRDLLHERRHLVAGFVGFGGGTRRALARGGEPRLYLSRVHLPLHPLFPRRFLSGLELDQPLPLTTEAFVESHALHLVRVDLAVQGGEPGLHFRQARRQALDLGGRVRRLALRVGGGALGVAFRRGRFELLVAGLLRRLGGRREGGFRRGELGERALQRGRGGPAGRFGVRDFLGQRIEIGPSLQRSASLRPPRRRATRQEHGPVGPSQRAAPASFAVQHLVSGEQRVHPRRRRPVHAQTLLEGMPVRGERGAGYAGEQHERARLRLVVPTTDRVHCRGVPHEDRMQPFAQQLFRQLRVAPPGAHEIREWADHRVAELRFLLEQRLRRRGEPHPLALQLGECVAPGRHLRQRLFGLTPRRASARLPLLELRHLAPSPLQLFRGLRHRQLERRGLLRPGAHGGCRSPLGYGARGPLLRGLRQLLTQLAAFALERRALELERPDRLRPALHRLLQLPHGGALCHQPVAHLLLERGTTRQLLPRRPEVALRGRALGFRCRPLALRLQRAPRFLLAPPARGGAPLARIRPALHRLLQLPHGGALCHQPVAHLLLERGTTRQLLPRRPEVALRGRALGFRCRPLALRLQRAPRFLLAPPARGGAPLARIPQPLGGEREVALEATYVQPRLVQPALDVGAPCLGGVPGLDLRFACLLGVRLLRALRRKRRRQLLRPLPQAPQREIEVLELVSHQRERDPEALLGHLDIALRLAALPRQAAHLCLDLAHQVLESGEVRRRLFQAALRARLAVAVQPDPGRFFEQGAPLLGLLGQERLDHLGFHYDRGVRTQ